MSCHGDEKGECNDQPDAQPMTEEGECVDEHCIDEPCEGDEPFVKGKSTESQEVSNSSDATASHVDWPHVSDDDRPGKVKPQDAKSNPNSKRHRNR